jgi:hypothetical protein
MKKWAMVLFGILCAAVSLLAAADKQSDADWQTFIDGTYKVMLRCPADWKPLERYDVSPGMHSQDRSRFFGFFVSGGVDNSAQQLCKADADHKLRPFGTSPAIRLMQVQGQDACLIWPSAGQKKDNDAELIVKYPAPVRINDTNYSFLTLDADKEEIMDLAHSLKFLEPDPPKAPFLMEIAFEDRSASDGIFEVGAPVVLTITLKNNSERVLRIPFSDRERDYRILVTDIAGQTQLIAKYQPPGRDKEATATAQPVTLSAHSVYQMKFDTGLQYQLLSPALHALHGQMKLPEELGPGLVNSNTLSLNIVAGQRSEPPSNHPQRQPPSEASPRN